jgi:sugar lactone lactonase YvrE
MSAVECVLAADSLLGEGALWDPAAQVLWWIDIKGRSIHRFDPASGDDMSWPTPHDVGSLALRRAGGLVVAMRHGFYFFHPADGTFTTIVEPEAGLPENRFNDGKPDRQGRFWAGSLHDAETRPTGGLYRLDTDLSCTRLVEGIFASNALAFGAESEVLYYGDSRQRVVWAWDFDRDDGAIHRRRVFVELQAGEGAPDGAAVDSAGGYWLTQPDGWCICRYDPSGRRDRTIRMPVQRPTCVAFGGPDLRTLYCTSCRWGLSAADLHAQPLAGGLFAIAVDVAGLPDAAFAG